MKKQQAPHSATHQTLIARIRDQYDGKSWDEFTRGYKAYICAVIRNMNISQNDIDDISQEVLLGVWRQLPNFTYEPANCRFRTWLCVVIRNQVVNYCQKQANHRKKMADLAEMADSGSGPIMELPEVEKIADLEWKKHVTDLAWAVVQEQFDGKAIQSFELLMAGHDPNEVAARLGIERNSVYVHRKRVKERMLQEINRLNEELS